MGESAKTVLEKSINEKVNRNDLSLMKDMDKALL